MQMSAARISVGDAANADDDAPGDDDVDDPAEPADDPIAYTSCTMERAIVSMCRDRGSCVTNERQSKAARMWENRRGCVRTHVIRWLYTTSWL